MPLSKLDFGNSIVPLSGTDAFFLDSNMIIAYFDEKDKRHLACFCFISYLIKNDVVICTSEVVLTELVNTLARIFYVDDQCTKYFEANGCSPNSKEKGNFRLFWGERVIKNKNEPQILNRFNTMAAQKLSPFIEKTLLVECTDNIISDYLRLIQEKELASSDAMIISTALNFGCQYIISMDRDMSINDDVDVISTSILNTDYDYNSMLDRLDIREYLRGILGETEFNRKFPSPIVQRNP